MTARVVLADDHAPTLAEFAALLRADPRFEVCATACDAVGAVAAALEHAPDLVLLDVCMPGSGIAAAAEIAARLPATRVVMLTISAHDADLFPALRAGAAGYLLKDIGPDRLGHALLDVLEGRGALPRDLLARVIADYRDPQPPRRRVAAPAPLTAREWQVLDRLRGGRSTAQIARELCVSSETVRSHVMRATRKLGVGDRDAAVALLAAQPPVRGVARTGGTPSPDAQSV